jgi:hypothetical protein
MLPVLLAALAALALGGHALGPRDAHAQPPELVQGFPPPDDRYYILLPEDDSSPASQEGVTEDPGQAGTTRAPGAPGTVLASDDFSNPATGLLARASSRPDRWKVGYLNGEYQLASLAAGVNLADTAVIAGTYGDVSISTKVRIVQGPATAADQTARLYCRRQTSGSGFTGYRLQYSPLLDLFAIYRGDGNSGATLTDVRPIAGAPVSADTHRLTLSCAGSTITAAVDGVTLASIQDNSYHDGQAALGVGNFTRFDPWGIVPAGSGYPGTYDVRFSSLVLTQP